MVSNLKLFLIEHWYSQNRTDADLARRLEVSHAAVSQWINGEEEPTLARKIQIAKALMVDSRMIWPEVKEERAKND